MEPKCMNKLLKRFYMRKWHKMPGKKGLNRKIYNFFGVKMGGKMRSPLRKAKDVV